MILRIFYNGDGNGDDNGNDLGSQENVTEVFNVDSTALGSLGLLQIR